MFLTSIKDFSKASSTGAYPRNSLASFSEKIRCISANWFSIQSFITGVTAALSLASLFLMYFFALSSEKYPSHNVHMVHYFSQEILL